MRISDWSSDVCSSDLGAHHADAEAHAQAEDNGGEHVTTLLVGAEVIGHRAGEIGTTWWQHAVHDVELRQVVGVLRRDDIGEGCEQRQDYGDSQGSEGDWAGPELGGEACHRRPAPAEAAAWRRGGRNLQGAGHADTSALPTRGSSAP